MESLNPLPNDVFSFCCFKEISTGWDQIQLIPSSSQWLEHSQNTNLVHVLFCVAGFVTLHLCQQALLKLLDTILERKATVQNRQHVLTCLVIASNNGAESTQGLQFYFTIYKLVALGSTGFAPRRRTHVWHRYQRTLETTLETTSEMTFISASLLLYLIVLVYSVFCSLLPSLVSTVLG